MTILNVGAAVEPPQMGVGSSSTTPTATCGLAAGANPINDAV
jgi:hypothetical protein